MSQPAQPVTAITVDDGVEAVTVFFRALGHNCAAQDFEATEPLFAPDVVSFGTKASVAEGLATLRANQWQQIWPNIENFEVLLEQLRASASGDGKLAWGMLPWTSTGFDESGAPFDRPGRATVVLERRDGRWLCIHSHFSLAPGTPPQSFGRPTSPV